MQPFQTISSRIIVLPYANIDTDQIIPARYLKVTDKDGLAEGLFAGWRYRADGTPNSDFPLNRSENQGARILLAGDNFACGSSREHAPWALVGWGIRAVVSSSFADIFRNNALKNGLLPIVVDPETHSQIFRCLDADPQLEATVDLSAQSLVIPGCCQVTFPIDAFSKTCLLAGVDEMGYLLEHEAQIAAFEQAMA